MKCSYHSEADSNFTCSECNASICKDCAVNNNGKIICVKCAEVKGLNIVKNQGNKDIYKHSSNPKDSRTINIFWATVLSFIPGAGHMYLGIMKRGLQLMVAFFGLIAVSNVFYSADFIGLFSVIVWFYSVFDCYHIRKKLQHGEIVEEDLFFNIDLKKINLTHAGLAAVVIGGVILLNEALDQMIYMSRRFYFDPIVFRFLRNSIFPVLLITLGLFLIRKAKKGFNS